MCVCVVCMCVCVHACVRACVRACVHTYWTCVNVTNETLMSVIFDSMACNYTDLFTVNRLFRPSLVIP